MSKKIKRLLCFYCKYEISKHNKSEKYVKYNGKIKAICKNCNAKTHKTLQGEYEHNDVQCKIIEKVNITSKCQD